MSKSVMMTVCMCVCMYPCTYIYIIHCMCVNVARKDMEHMHNKRIEIARISNGPAQVQKALPPVLFELERTHRCVPKVYIVYRLKARGS